MPIMAKWITNPNPPTNKSNLQININLTLKPLALNLRHKKGIFDINGLE